MGQAISSSLTRNAPAVTFATRWSGLPAAHMTSVCRTGRVAIQKLDDWAVVSLQREGDMSNYWWVNQNQTFREEAEAGILWAPLSARNQTPRAHWDAMDRVAQGDFVLHYANQRVSAASVVTTAALPARRPPGLPTDMWDQDGRLVRSRYALADRPVHRDELPEGWRADEPVSGPFQRNLGVKQGYLFPLSRTFFARFKTQFGDRFPNNAFISGPVVSAAPAEARAGAEDLLRRLIGVPLSTPSGARNIVLGVSRDVAWVRTERSPQGQPVSISQVQAAIDLLLAEGHVAVEPTTIGHRSAFIGAVLATLPNVAIEGSPPVARVNQPHNTGADMSWPPDDVSITFQGSLAAPFAGIARGEQTLLRKVLFGAADESSCALCGTSYPVRFLVAAHIKRRSVCTEKERRDVTHIAMPACVFGCDSLFEFGYISVGTAGSVIVSDSTNPAVQRRLLDLAGRTCLSYTRHSAGYFSWHVENVWRGVHGAAAARTPEREPGE